MGEKLVNRKQAAPRLGAAQGVESCGAFSKWQRRTHARKEELHFLNCIQLCLDATKKLK